MSMHRKWEALLQNHQGPPAPREWDGYDWAGAVSLVQDDASYSPVVPVLFSFRALLCFAGPSSDAISATSLALSTTTRSTETLSIAVKTTTAAAALPMCLLCICTIDYCDSHPDSCLCNSRIQQQHRALHS